MENLLEQRWCELWAKLNARGNPLPVLSRLRRCYSEPHRAYHNLRHIGECLDSLAEVQAQAASAPTIALALWFHDAVYDTHRSDNEEQSSILLKTVAEEQGIESCIIQSACELVLATKLHTGSGNPDIPLMVDIDLKILGENPERFDEYERDIRREYDWVPASVFAEKRAEILEQFLARPSIYTTPHFQKQYEQRARKNLVRSIAWLKAVPN